VVLEDGIDVATGRERVVYQCGLLRQIFVGGASAMAASFIK
jgi:hypothetical protein